MQATHTNTQTHERTDGQPFANATIYGLQFTTTTNRSNSSRLYMWSHTERLHDAHTTDPVFVDVCALRRLRIQAAMRRTNIFISSRKWRKSVLVVSHVGRERTRGWLYRCECSSELDGFSSGCYYIVRWAFVSISLPSTSLFLPKNLFLTDVWVWFVLCRQMCVFSVKK